MTGVCSRCAERSWLSVRLCTSAVDRAESVCRHHCLYPEHLHAKELAPDVLSVRGGAERLRALVAKKVVAIAGTRAPSDYGEQVAQTLARDLAASGVTVTGVEDGMGEGACVWAREAGGSILVMSAWAPVPSFGKCSLTWPAGERILALLADLVIVVEADEDEWNRACAVPAYSRGARLAAVPGPVDSVSSIGSNALIAEGADVICNAQDALDALYGVGGRRVRRVRRRKPRKRSAIAQSAPMAEAPPETERPSGVETSPKAEPPSAFKPPPGLETELAAVLERVRNGEDTLAKLCVGMPTCDELTLALTELELLGLLRREQDGRYMMP
jgi:predicted Rossmann fold nucleotide-binding protein DprA/Smf involved in DNA uptake